MQSIDRAKKQGFFYFQSIAVYILLFISFSFVYPVSADSLKTNPVEVGNVTWGRDYKDALSRSKVTGKPILLLFQEVPGCIGCKNFGRTVLTQPDLVMAIENEFIPVLVFNNRTSGMDAELLKQFKEPAWNYQVIRFIDAGQKDIIPRRDRIWDTKGVASRMIEALDAVGRPAPRYLVNLATGNFTNEVGTTHDQ